MRKKRHRRPRPADIDLTASVAADELRFQEVPETEVRFFGEPGYESESGNNRVNLPERVKAGETYRRIRVDYRLANRLAGGREEPACREGEEPKRREGEKPDSGSRRAS
jgi:hypothetical protein